MWFLILLIAIPILNDCYSVFFDRNQQPPQWSRSLKGRFSKAPSEQPEIVAFTFPGVTINSFPKMASASVAAAAAAAAAAANRDPAVDRSLRSVFGKFVDIFPKYFFLNASLICDHSTASD